jgi:hypothetical protein
LLGPREWAGNDLLKRDIKPREERGDLFHFLLAAIGQRPLVVGLFPIRPIGFTVPEKIKVHRLPFLEDRLPAESGSMPNFHGRQKRLRVPPSDH